MVLLALVSILLAPWTNSLITSYATSEPLTGCTGIDKNGDGEIDCYTASGQLLRNSKYTMAGNGFKFGTRIEILNWDGRRMHHCIGTVNDRTGSNYRFEFSYALSRCVGAPYDPLIRGRWLTWSDYVSWRIYLG